MDEGGVVDDLPPVAEQLDVAVGDESSAEPGSKAEKRTALALSQRRGWGWGDSNCGPLCSDQIKTFLGQFRLGKDSARKDFVVVFDTEVSSIIHTFYHYTSLTHLCVMRNL